MLYAATFIIVLALTIVSTAGLHWLITRRRSRPVKMVQHQGFSMYRLDDGWHAYREEDGLYLSAADRDTLLGQIEECG